MCWVFLAFVGVLLLGFFVGGGFGFVFLCVTEAF